MLYSIRMRAAKGGSHETGGTHISGAERIVEDTELSTIASELITRALHHAKGQADYINLTIDTVNKDNVIYIKSLPIETHTVNSVEEGHATVTDLLVKSGITPTACNRAIQLLLTLTTNMRGAILLDAVTGKRLDCTNDRGIRVSHMDSIQSNTVLSGKHHMYEALTLASKASSCNGILGELCWSDDPDYVIGYVSCNHTYHRISKMKIPSSPIGGRVFFIQPHMPVEPIIDYLENTDVLVDINHACIK